MSSAQQQARTGDESVLAPVSWKRGVGYGILTFVLNLVLISLLFLLDVSNAENGVGIYDHEGWRDHVVADFGGRFLLSHQGAYNSPSLRTLEAFEHVPKEDLIAIRGFDTVPEAVFILIPILLMGIFGYLAASRASAYLDEVSGALQGASLTLAYAPLIAAIVLVFGALLKDLSGDMFTDQLTGVLFLAGIFYPVLCGGIGGFIAGLRARAAESEQPAPGGSPGGSPQGAGPAQGHGGQSQQPQGQPQGQQPQGQPQGQQPQGQSQPGGDQDSGQAQGNGDA